jgi:hypothetical protein
MAEIFKDMDKLPEEMQKFMIYAKKTNESSKNLRHANT